jgi:hypothetical protein
MPLRIRMLVVVAGAILLATSACKKEDFCCMQYDAGSPEAGYCDNHRDAVGKFIRSVSDLEERQARLQDFQQFYDAVSGCQTVACIDSALDTTAYLPGFAEEYEIEHNFADADSPVPETQKAELILCGFDHAIAAMDQVLNER